MHDIRGIICPIRQVADSTGKGKHAAVPEVVAVGNVLFSCFKIRFFHKGVHRMLFSPDGYSRIRFQGDPVQCQRWPDCLAWRAFLARVTALTKSSGRAIRWSAGKTSKRMSSSLCFLCKQGCTADWPGPCLFPRAQEGADTPGKDSVLRPDSESGNGVLRPLQ